MTSLARAVVGTKTGAALGATGLQLAYPDGIWQIVDSPRLTKMRILLMWPETLQWGRSFYTLIRKAAESRSSVRIRPSNAATSKRPGLTVFPVSATRTA